MSRPVKLIIVAGARPNFMKIASFIGPLRQAENEFSVYFVATVLEHGVRVLPNDIQKRWRRRVGGRFGRRGAPAATRRWASATTLAAGREYSAPRV